MKRLALASAVPLAAALLITALIWLPTLGNGFTNWDDPLYVTSNEAVRNPTWRGAAGFLTSFTAANYHPLTMLSLALDAHLWGLDPAPFHAVNLAFHLGGTALVFLVAAALGSGALASFLTAILFGVHPLHVESVAWISERKDVLSTFFFLGAWLAYLKGAGREGGRRFPRGAFVLFVLALLSKSTAVTFPLVMLLSDYLGGRRLDRRSILEKAPFLAASLLFGVIALLAQGSAQSIRQGDAFPLAEAPLIAGYGLAFYLVKLAAPLRLSAVYPYPSAPGGGLPAIFPLAAVLSGSLLGLSLWFGRASRKVVFGVLFFLVTILPVLQFIPLGYAVAADRYTYLPSVGLFWLGAEGFAAGLERLRRRGVWPMAAASVAAGLWIAGLALLTILRIPVWRDSVTLWENALASYPAAPVAHSNLGMALAARGEKGPAREHFDRAIALSPGNPADFYNRGLLLAGEKRHGEALADFNAAIRLDPAYYMAWCNRGASRSDTGDTAGAMADYDRAIALDPSRSNAWYGRGNVRRAAGDAAGALADYDAALARAPGWAEAWNNRAAARVDLGDLQGAIDDYTRAVTLKPDFAAALANRGVVRMQLGDAAGAIDDYTRALALAPGTPRIHRARAEAWRALGDENRAAEDLNRAGEPLSP
jgi:tetratricopeptide (TPR) repeat protein